MSFRELLLDSYLIGFSIRVECWPIKGILVYKLLAAKMIYFTNMQAC